MRGTLGFWVWCVVVGTSLGQGSGKPVAVVNGEPISRADFDAVLKVRPQPLTPLSAAQNRQVNEQVLAMLIDEALLRQHLAKHTPVPDPREVEKQFASLVDGLKAQNKSLAEFCRETQQSERQVRSGVESMIRWQSYMKSRASDSELQKYFEESRDFFDKTTVQCSHVVYRVPHDAPASDKANAETKMRELRAQILGGKLTFVEAAQKYSHCPSASKGGNLGSIFRKMMVEEPFAAAAFKLNPGELSDIVWTDYGVHLILVTARKPGQPSDFAKIKDDVRECYMEEMRFKLVADLRKSAKAEVLLDR